MSAYNWSNEDVYKLIEMFEAREVLWNTMSEDYKNRNKKHDAWTEIANEFNLDKRVIEKKIRSLVGQFNRECKPKSGAGADDSSKWFAYKKLMFLKGKNIPSSTVDGGLQMITERESLIAPKGKRIKLQQSLDVANPKNQSDDAQYKTFTECCQTKKSDVDECDLYAQLLAQKLRKIDEDRRLLLMHDIDNLVFKAIIAAKAEDRNTALTSSYSATTPSPSHHEFVYIQSPSSSFSQASIHITKSENNIDTEEDCEN